MKRYLFPAYIAILLTPDLHLKAQDPQFSQFYATPLYLNPALTGATDRARAGINYRIQWPSLTHSFTTTSAYIDYFAKTIESGVGLIITSHRESFLGFRSNEIGIPYVYKLRISKNAVLRTGLQFSYFNKHMDFERVVFGNQINVNTGQLVGPHGEAFDFGPRVNFISLSAGTLLYSNNTWLGVSLHHINQPNQSFLNRESRLEQKLSVHAGYKVMFAPGRRLRTLSYDFQERSVTFAMNYKRQGPFNQLDLGAQLYLQPLVIGAWYRGIPLQKAGNIAKHESVIMLFGLEINKDLSFGYSYDFTVSRLAGATGGAHEISLSLTFGKIVKRTRRDTILPCFKY